MCGVKKGEGTFFVCFFVKLSRSEVRVGLGSFFVIDVIDEAVTSKKYILRYTRKVVFSRVLGSRFFANSFFIVFSKLFHSFLKVIS